MFEYKNKIHEVYNCWGIWWQTIKQVTDKLNKVLCLRARKVSWKLCYSLWFPFSQLFLHQASLCDCSSNKHCKYKWNWNNNLWMNLNELKNYWIFFEKADRNDKCKNWLKSLIFQLILIRSTYRKVIEF